MGTGATLQCSSPIAARPSEHYLPHPCLLLITCISSLLHNPGINNATKPRMNTDKYGLKRCARNYFALGHPPFLQPLRPPGNCHPPTNNSSRPSTCSSAGPSDPSSKPHDCYISLQFVIYIVTICVKL